MDALGMTMSLRTESLDADASNVSEATPRATRKRAREAIFARFDERAARGTAGEEAREKELRRAGVRGVGKSER